MTDATTAPASGRRFEMALDLPASAERVWRALTDPRELERWFPLQATVRPDEGGEMRWGWDGKWEWVWAIDRWEPGRRLRLVQEDQRPFDGAGGMLPEGRTSPATLMIEFSLESAAGGTTLRLVHSGFGSGGAWDDEYEGISVGWQFEIRSLRHYLRRHDGKNRIARLVPITTPLPHGEAWARLGSTGGFRFAAWPPVIGDRFAVEFGEGRRLGGVVEHWIPERDFSGVSPELDDGIFRLGSHRASGRTGLSVWLSTYDPGRRSLVDEMAGEARRVLERLFG